MQIELEADAENLEFENEHQLGTKPKEIDILIIKKEANHAVHKNIGRIFRKYNIVEYKSPTDSLSIDDFYLVYGYACFYKADTGAADVVKIDEITITLACSHYPRELIKHWKKRGYEITNVENGVFYIIGDRIPIQLILIHELSEKENMNQSWISSCVPMETNSRR